ncbi:uncharacterized protein LOC114805082 [Zeugodacus cucurbitae]|uniref:uncharacterized protein LOC114805082 n=1 Tax=Zeugodacus cucurbitae TaxID=28588 RepID=UPI0023D90E12|nr:uncharacterized protein LOC114805082 [Zeugodacus cucurbitae]XP_054082110.1 uncharacterized protein LOC114805082 [Zeugodacus cucurbitae]
MWILTALSQNKEFRIISSLLLEAIGKTLRPSRIDLQFLPINSMVKLDSAEELIKNKPESEVISYIKFRINNIKLEKALTKIFDDNVLLKINWGGSKNITAINRYRLFNFFFFE